MTTWTPETAVTTTWTAIPSATGGTSNVTADSSITVDTNTVTADGLGTGTGTVWTPI